MTTLSDGVLDFSPRRTGAMMLRYWYLLRSSWPRLLDLVYWPTVQMITWGFLQFYIMQNAGFFAQAAPRVLQQPRRARYRAQPR